MTEDRDNTANVIDRKKKGDRFAADDVSTREFSLTRVYEAPLDLVYKIWTDPRYVALWWGVEDATNPVCELDVRTGGQWRIDMRTVSGKTYRNHGVYLEVIENKRIVYTDIPDLAEWQGNPPHPGVHTVTFLHRGKRTEVTLTVRMNSKADRDRMLALGMSRGIAQSFDRLKRLLETLVNPPMDRAQRDDS